MLGHKHNRPWWGNPYEWAGYYLFGVGVYGTLYRQVTRHLTLWGVVPLDWVYLGLLAGGACLLFLYSPNSPFYLGQGDFSSRRVRDQLWLTLRGAVCLTLLGSVVVLGALY